MKKIWIVKTISLFLALVVIALLWKGLWDLVKINLLSVQISRALIADREHLPPIYEQLKQKAAMNCRLEWHLGVVAGALGDVDEQEAAWSRFLVCDPGAALKLVRASASQNEFLAQQAVSQVPGSADSWFWLAGILAEKDPGEAIQAYSTGLEIAPTNGYGWCQIGKLQESAGDFASAERAFLNCCYNGDPGSNGCWGAGRLAEARGDIAAAVRYYRASKWQESKDRGDALISLSK